MTSHEPCSHCTTMRPEGLTLSRRSLCEAMLLGSVKVLQDSLWCGGWR